MHEVNHKDSKVTKRGASGSKVSEGFVSGSINDKESRNLDLSNLDEEIIILTKFGDVALQGSVREVSGSDLLGDTSCLSCLHVCGSNLIKQESLSCINMSKNTNDRASQ
jgi:hypothetical protein